MGSIGEWARLAMKTKLREYLTKARRCEERARKIRDAENREWQAILARAYRMLAEAESELGSKLINFAAAARRS